MDFSGTDGVPEYNSGTPVDVPHPSLLTDVESDLYSNPLSAKDCQGCEHRMSQMEALVTTLRDQQVAMVKSFNTIGTQQQEMWDGIGNLMRFFNSIAADLNTMTLGDKIKLASQLAKGGTL